MKIRLFVALAAVASLTFACKKEDPAEPVITNTEKPIEVATAYPWLKTGHRWVYDFIYGGKVVDSLVTEVKSEKDGNFELRTYDMMEDQTSYQYMDKEGNLWSYYKSDARDKATMTTKYNPQVGDKWVSFNGMDTTDVTVKSVDASVTVPAGIFTCTHLELVGRKTKYVFNYYIRKDMYLVKMDMMFGSQTAIYALRKKNY